MAAAKHTGRIIGAMLLIQMVGGALDNFVLMAPVHATPGYLVNATLHSTRVGISALVGLSVGLLSVGIAIAAFTAFSRHSLTAALWLVALAVAGLSAAAVENGNVMSLLSLSQSYAKAGLDDPALYPALRQVVAAARNWSHYIGMIISGLMLLVFYGSLFRFTLIPRALAAAGIAAVLLQLGTVSAPLFGRDAPLPMLLPLFVVQLTTALWLIARGFQSAAVGSMRDERQPP